MSAVSNPLLQQMLQRGQVFAGYDFQSDCPQSKYFSTGYESLDKALGGGLTGGRLHEVQLPFPFCGEAHLWRDAVQSAFSHHAPVFWINPPATLHMPGLNYYSSAHLPAHFILEALRDDELVWCTRQILQEITHGVVVLWHESPEPGWVRQWQRSLRHEGLTVFVFSLYMSSTALPYHTRLKLIHQEGRIRWDILKRPGGWPVQTQWEIIQPTAPVPDGLSVEGK